MLDKADEVTIDAAGSFVNDMQDMYMYMMIASGVGLAGVGVWWVVGSRGKKSVA
jgi:peptide deformylase